MLWNFCTSLISQYGCIDDKHHGHLVSPNVKLATSVVIFKIYQSFIQLNSVTTPYRRVNARKTLTPLLTHWSCVFLALTQPSYHVNTAMTGCPHNPQNKIPWFPWYSSSVGTLNDKGRKLVTFWLNKQRPIACSYRRAMGQSYYDNNVFKCIFPIWNHKDIGFKFYRSNIMLLTMMTAGVTKAQRILHHNGGWKPSISSMSL